MDRDLIKLDPIFSVQNRVDTTLVDTSIHLGFLS